MGRCPGHVYQLCDSLHARVQVVTSDGWRQVSEGLDRVALLSWK